MATVNPVRLTPKIIRLLQNAASTNFATPRVLLFNNFALHEFNERLIAKKNFVLHEVCKPLYIKNPFGT